MDPTVAAQGEDTLSAALGEPPAESVEGMVDALKDQHEARITGELVIPAQEGAYAAFPDALDPRLVKALQARRIGQLYTHQRQAWETVVSGTHTVIVTPTASGKTLCYNLPVLQAALREKAKALVGRKAAAPDPPAEG